MIALTSEQREALAALGFTAAEAETYLVLLQTSPTTAYRVSQRTGRPVANTYKAVASLQQKGAVLVDDGASRLCRAVAPDELLAARARAFDAHRERARHLFSSLRRDEDDERVYRIASTEQVLERARQMLAAAREVVLVDAFPAALRALATQLQACARRGPRVVVKVYEPPGTDLDPIETVLANDAAHALEVWPGQQLSLVSDAETHLLALLDDDLRVVHQGVWSASAFLSCMQHNHLANEIRLTAVHGQSRLAPGRTLDSLSILDHEPAGLQALRRRLAPAAETTIEP